ncbi:hypothetical protein H6P81_010905 [Aristolochia fimbriata]|uniref:Uncharacterized protein n=1 Tax=Aristolochia fimbriata TaxID=158543 RepID=A0AAV7ES72_ARIFI|nr:hypothetical protein H6P81_010905 [Aristolochia fimbriata]
MTFWAAFLRIFSLFLLLSSGVSQGAEVVSPDFLRHIGGRVPAVGMARRALPGRPVGRRGLIP